MDSVGPGSAMYSGTNSCTSSVLLPGYRLDTRGVWYSVPGIGDEARRVGDWPWSGVVDVLARGTCKCI